MSAEQVLVLAISAFCLGVSKAGFSGVSLISVFLLAEHFGAKASLGLALPMMLAADLMVYPLFRKYGSWGPVWKFLWPALIGMGVALWGLSALSNEVVRVMIGWIILGMVAIQSFKKWAPKAFDRMAHSHGFGIGAGVCGGVATMMANAAGPIMQLYLLSKKMPKMELIGVGARFFLLVNLLKMPLNAGLDLISWESLRWNAWMLPAIAIGVLLGKKLLVKVPQRAFEAMVVVFSLIAGLRLAFG
ncbi:sulfite exporter TauE/SafE family protein [Rubritalea tangerina]|uniref:Probable membrane transporter protein n=1 Tax=Rubritalea tangerina TaxID=430798 RepID=A0ABW4Z7T7_9BACT